MEKNDLFFITTAKDFDIDKMELHSHWKKDWINKCEMAANRPDRYKRHIDMLLDIMAFEPGITVLDVGCGVGRAVIELANLGANCVGLEAAEDAVRLINRVQYDFGLNVTGVHGDACALPFDDKTFDVVMSFQFFEHVIDIDLAIKEQVRVLKTGGKLIIEQANFLGPYTLFSLLVRYPLRTHGKRGGIKWLFTKGKVRENMYGEGWTGKDEDIHSRLWWKRKVKQYSELKINEFTSGIAKRKGSFFKILTPFVGNILIIATKQ